MQTYRVTLLTVLVVAGLTAMALAQQPGSAPQSAKPGGLIVEVSDAVQNFQQIQPGDQVVLRFTEALALAVVKP